MAAIGLPIGTYRLREFLTDQEFRQVVLKIVEFNEGLDSSNQFGS